MNLSASGEVGTFVNVSQFHSGDSAYECVAYAAALCKYMGPPEGHPQGTPSNVEDRANYWYGRLTGSFGASSMSGMSLEQLHIMLTDLDLHWRGLPIDGNSSHSSDIAHVKASLVAGNPVIICGSETGFYDMKLGDRVPYNWVPRGNHAIVATGIAQDGNILVRDTANIDPSLGIVRLGPRCYDAGKMFLVSGTEIIPNWSEGVEFMPIDVNNGVVATYFEATSDTQWKCKRTGYIIQNNILHFYRAYGQNAFCGLTYLGLPKSNEIPVENHPGIVKQHFERGSLILDPGHAIDHPPGAGEVYTMFVS